ncbi:MAG: type II secretion system protein [Chthoniobacteraceae bacterium]
MLLGISRKHGPHGYTIAEVLVALAVIGLFASSLMWGLTMMNNYAVLGRLYSGAMEAVQEQIDLVLTDGAFSPNNNTSAPVSGITPRYNIELPVLSSGSSSSATATSVPIYLSDSSKTVEVDGTMTTKVENTGTTYNLISGNSTNLNIYRITVTMIFTYRGKTYSVTSATMRAPDTN